MIVTMARMSPSAFTSAPSFGLRRTVLPRGWSPATLSVEMSTNRTGSVAVMTVVTCSLTVSSSSSRGVSCARSKVEKRMHRKMAVRFLMFISIGFYSFLISLELTRYTKVPYLRTALFLRIAFPTALVVR